LPKSAITLFDHVACGVRRVADVAPLLEFHLGAKPHRGGPGAGFRGGQWAFAGEARLELIEPDGPADGFLHRFLDAHGPAIHHVTFKVKDIHAARDRAIALGYDVVGFRDDDPAWKECFLHPKQVGGIVVQMAEVDPDSQSDNWLPFAAVTTGAPERIVALKALRLVTRDAAKARRCWVDLLGADVETTAERAVEIFRWPGSPLALRVIHDPAAAQEGPAGLEFEAFGAAFPPTLAPLLGANLLQVSA
jgi:hypothetical protein